jgi:hypothetical protein
MNKNSPKLALIYVQLPIAVNVDLSALSGRLAMEAGNAKIAEKEFHLLFDQCKARCVKLGAGVVLAEEDFCYPAILSAAQWCQKQQYPFAIAPLGKRSLTLSPDYQGLTEWLSSMEQGHRLTGFPLPREKKTP